MKSDKKLFDRDPLCGLVRKFVESFLRFISLSDFGIEKTERQRKRLSAVEDLVVGESGRGCSWVKRYFRIPDRRATSRVFIITENNSNRSDAGRRRKKGKRDSGASF